jgi:glyoxylase-like metal-dependent hydrolase (beta-lactamase superfamily II)
MMGYTIQGLHELLEHQSVPVHVQADETPWLQRVTDTSRSELVEHTSGDVVTVGDVAVELIHTPGHTPGSQCFLVGPAGARQLLVAGDTLFLEGCGRTDLPGGDARLLYESLTQKLAKVPDDAVLFPGHLYSAEPSATMGETRRWNYVFRPRDEREWLATFGQ